MRREGPECEAQDRIRDAPGEHPAPLLTDQFRLGHRPGGDRGLHPGEFPAFDDAHEWWERYRGDKDFSKRARSEARHNPPDRRWVARARTCDSRRGRFGAEVLFEENHFFRYGGLFRKLSMCN